MILGFHFCDLRLHNVGSCAETASSLQHRIRLLGNIGLQLLWSLLACCVGRYPFGMTSQTDYSALHVRSSAVRARNTHIGRRSSLASPSSVAAVRLQSWLTYNVYIWGLGWEADDLALSSQSSLKSPWDLEVGAWQGRPVLPLRPRVNEASAFGAASSALLARLRSSAGSDQRLVVLGRDFRRLETSVNHSENPKQRGG